MSVVDLLRESPADGGAIALVGAERAWTYAELDDVVTARADALRAGGAIPGRVAPILLQPDAAGVVELLAHWRLGTTLAPLNPRLTEPERSAALAALAGVSVDAQAILWTSGTAGRPRGVAISFEALRASTVGAAARLALRAGDVWLASLSPAHVGGLALVGRSLLLGGTLVAVGAFEAPRTWSLLRGLGPAHVRGLAITHVSVVPTQLLRLLDESRDEVPPASFVCALVGGAEIPGTLLARALAAGWPVALTYGLTEATSQVATAPPELTRRKPGTVGRPLDGVEVRVGADDQILVRGRTLASRYVGSEAGPLVDPEGWHHTGDLGRLDDDGDLWIVGRKADRIVSGGVTIDAVEVEEVLRGDPEIADACVVGVPDPEWGERVAAWVEPSSGRLDLDRVDRHARSRLSAAKVPRLYHAGGALPRNPNGKVDRAAVRAELARLREAPPGPG
jgi:O-succinylbenzoic acid--CoA ligase